MLIGKSTFGSSGQNIHCRSAPHRKDDTIWTYTHFLHIWNAEMQKYFMVRFKNPINNSTF